MRQACLLGALMLACGASGASAQDTSEGAGEWRPSVEAGVASAYVFRGVDQTRGRGEGFAGGEFDGSVARLGAWTSNVAAPGRGGATTREEFDLYGAWLTSLAGFDAELGAIGYVFSGDRSRPDLVEVYGRLARTMGPVRFTGSAYLGYGERDAQDAYAELKADYPLTARWSVFGAAGHLYQSRPTVLNASAGEAPDLSLNDTTWSVGTAYSVTERIGLELRWSDSDHSGPGYTSQVFLTARARLF